MPSNAKPARALLRPGADFDERAIPVTRQPQRIWFRVHKAGSPAILFTKLPHHRFSHPHCPFPLLYAGATIQTCLWEYFGDDVFQGKRAIAAGKWQGCCLSRIVVPELKACAIREKTLDSMSPILVNTYSNIGQLYRAKNDLAKPAATASASNTACRSPGALAIMRRMSLVAACCSKASARSKRSFTPPMRGLTTPASPASSA